MEVSITITLQIGLQATCRSLDEQLGGPQNLAQGAEKLERQPKPQRGVAIKD